MFQNCLLSYHICKISGILTNSVDPDQIASQEQSDQDLHCLLRHFLPSIFDNNCN